MHGLFYLDTLECYVGIDCNVSQASWLAKYLILRIIVIRAFP